MYKLQNYVTIDQGILEQHHKNITYGRHWMWETMLRFGKTLQKHLLFAFCFNSLFCSIVSNQNKPTRIGLGNCLESTRDPAIFESILTKITDTIIWYDNMNSLWHNDAIWYGVTMPQWVHMCCEPMVANGKAAYTQHLVSWASTNRSRMGNRVHLWWGLSALIPDTGSVAASLVSICKLQVPMISFSNLFKTKKVSET